MASPLHSIVAWLAVAVLLEGCTGYPTEDAASPNPHDLSNGERLQALDALGAAYRAERSRFALDDSCTLRVTRSNSAEGVERFEQALTPELHVGVSFDKTARVFEVHLLSGSGPDAQRLGLLLRSSRVDAGDAGGAGGAADDPRLPTAAGRRVNLSAGPGLPRRRTPPPQRSRSRPGPAAPAARPAARSPSAPTCLAPGRTAAPRRRPGRVGSSRTSG
ncbi:hypothetical protein ABIC83_004753 [Roseateles asaccharophilus]